MSLALINYNDPLIFIIAALLAAAVIGFIVFVARRARKNSGQKTREGEFRR
ncbi:MAG TPA: hypothetical protein VF723_02970 [Pyrinomonadaceae bacterium]|jgi:uncharacterized protein YneF (UPF0154 family)